MPIVRDHFPEGGKPSELKRDPFLKGLCLHCVPDSILNEAENREDTWAFLLNARKLPQQCRNLFRAGASVQKAWERLAQMHYGGAFLNRSLLDEALKARAGNDTATTDKACIKLFRAIHTHGIWKDVPPAFKNEDQRTQFRQMREKEEEKISKRHGQHWQPTPLPTETEFEQANQEELIMTHAWLRWGLGEPGFCFYSDKALADMLALLMKRKRNPHLLDAQNAYYKKVRQHLGLKQWDYRKPIVTKARGVPETGLIEITLRLKKGEGKHLLRADNECVLGGKQFYPILP